MATTKNARRVRMDEIGMFLRTIELEFKPVSNKERAELIQQNFNVLCDEEDINHYEELEYFHNSDEAYFEEHITLSQYYY